MPSLNSALRSVGSTNGGNSLKSQPLSYRTNPWIFLVLLLTILPQILYQFKITGIFSSFDKIIENISTASSTTVCNQTQDGSPIKDLLQQRPPQPDQPTVPDKPLNVVILYPDDMRYDTLSAAGTQLVQTPFLDSLARDGIRFPYNSVTTSICWISRATLFTGQYLARHQSPRLPITTFYSPDRWNETWPYLLQKERGYFVGHIGKWQFRNYEDFVEKSFNWTRLFEGVHWHKLNTGEYVHTTDYTQNATLGFLRNRPKDRPFAVTAAFYPPKEIRGVWSPKPESMKLYENVTIPEPFDAAASWDRLPRTVFGEKNMGRQMWNSVFSNPELYQNSMKNMYRMITEVDEACKNIVDELERQGVLNETLIIFTTDNGALHGEHGLGGKWFPFAESIRVPLIIWDPRMPASKRGTIDESFTLNVDLAPTILGAAQIQKVPLGMQGRNIADLYLPKRNNYDDPSDNSRPWRQEFYYEHPTHLSEELIPKSSALVRKDFKYMRYDNLGVESFFHLKSDPMELHDVINHTVYHKTLVEMRKRYEELKQEVEKPPPYTGITV